MDDIAQPVLYNVQTRQPEFLDGPELQNAIMNGTHSFEKNQTVFLTKVGGDPKDKYTVASQDLPQMLKAGYQIVTPSQMAVDNYLKENSGAIGSAKVFLGELANQAGMGIPGILYEKNADPLDVAKTEALRKEHDFSDIAGGALGIATSLLTGGPVFKGAAKAGEAAEILAERLIAKSGGEIGKRTALEAARDVVSGVASKAAGGAAEGLVLTSPVAITEAMLGDHDQAAESLLAGVGIGSAFGVGSLAAKELFNLGKKGAEYAITEGKEKIESAKDLADATIKKAGEVFTGVPRESIEYYMQNPDRVDQTVRDYASRVGGDQSRILEPVAEEIGNSIKDIEAEAAARGNKLAEVTSKLETSFNAMKEDLKTTSDPLEFSHKISGIVQAERLNLEDVMKAAENAKANGDALEYLSLSKQIETKEPIIAEMERKFGTPERAYTAVDNLLKGKGRLAQDALFKFGAIAKDDFSGELDNIKNAKELLLKSDEELKPILVPNLMKQVDDVSKAYSESQAKLASVSPLAKVDLENSLKSLSNPSANPAKKQALKEISALSGKNYEQIVADLNNQREFDKARIIGSRNTTPLALAGGHLLGAPGYFLGAQVGKLLDVNGGSVMQKFIRTLYSNKRSDGVLFASKMMKQTAEKLDQIPEVLRSMSDKSPATARGLGISALLRLNNGNGKEQNMSGSYHQIMEKKTEQLKELNDKTSQWVSNPDSTAGVLSQLAQGLKEGGAPTVAESFSQKMLAGVQYLNQTMPKPPRPNTPFAPKVAWKPSDQELSRFEQRVSVVLDPFSVLDELKNNTLTRTHVETLKAVYPKTYEQIKNRIAKESINGIKPIPYNKRAKLSMLFETPLDPSQTPEAALGFQQTFLQHDPSMNPNNRAHVEIAKQAYSDVQRIMG